MANYFTFLFLVIIFTTLLITISHGAENDGEEEEKVEKILRVQLEDNGLKIVTMSDGEMFVNLELEKNGAIHDCKVVRRRRMALGMLKYDVRTCTKMSMNGHTYFNVEIVITYTEV